MWLFVLLLGWPMLESALFVVIGGQIGLWPTLAWVVVSAMLGVLVLRFQAARQAFALRDGLRDPARLAAGGALGMLGGLLLILPGFFSDAVGLLLLLPPVQAMAAAALGRRMHFSRPGQRAREREETVILEGDYTEVTPPRQDGPSGWTRPD